jgi:6-phosphogluconolactonase (cycloisomerase 2 family)
VVYRLHIALAGLALLAAFSGCGVQLRQPSTGSSGDDGGDLVIGSPVYEFVYAVDSTGNEIQPLVLNPYSATISISGLSSVSLASGSHFRARADGKFAYVAQYAAQGFAGFEIGYDGNLTAVAGSSWGLGSGGQTSETGSEGRDLYVASEAPGTIRHYTIGATGVPSLSSSYTPGANLAWLKLHANGRFLYAGSPTTGQIYGYTRNTSTGALAAMGASPFAAPAATSGIEIDASGSYLVAAGTGAGLRSYSIDSSTGALTPVTTIPSASGFTALALSGSGDYVYAIDSANLEVVGYSLDSGTGALVALGGSFPISLPNVNPKAIATDSTGAILFLGNSNGTISGYAIAPATGELAPVAGYPFATGLSSVDSIGVAVPSY